MFVDSPLALFTTLFGWQFYNAIWFSLLGSGIALLPFLGVIIEAFFAEREDGHFVGSDPVGIYKRLEAKILIMLVVVALAAQPFEGTRIDPSTIRFQGTPTILDQNPIEKTAQAPDNSFEGTNFQDFSQFDAGGVRVPIWWFAVLRVSSGINQSVLAGFPEIESLRDIARLAQAANISDPVVRSETNAFFTQCYLPAKGYFERLNPEGANPIDISWIGSRFFLEEFEINDTGTLVYDFLRADKSIKGFPFDESRDTDWSAEFQPDFGKPRCSEWWLGNNTNERPGLRDLLLEQVSVFEEGLADTVAAAITTRIPGSLGQEDIEDRIIQSVLTRDPPTIVRTSFGEAPAPFTESNFEVRKRLTVSVVSGLGVALGSTIFAVFLDVMTQALPMMQPMILMGIFALLPFALVASRYSLSFLMIGAIGIFTVNFWPVLWHMAAWVDDSLMVVLFPPQDPQNPEESPLASLLLFKRDLFGPLGETKLTLLNMITAGLFLLLPVLFTAVMGWAGIQTGKAVSAVTNAAMNNPALGNATTGAEKAPGIATRSLTARGSQAATTKKR